MYVRLNWGKAYYQQGAVLMFLEAQQHKITYRISNNYCVLIYYLSLGYALDLINIMTVLNMHCLVAWSSALKVKRQRSCLVKVV